MFEVCRRSDGSEVGQVAVDRVTGERYSSEGEGVLGDYGTMLTEDESESTDWSGSYTCESSGVSVTLSQTDPEAFFYAFSDGVSGAATAGKDSAASEDGAIRFLLHEGVLTVIGGGETGNYTLDTLSAGE